VCWIPTSILNRFKIEMVHVVKAVFIVTTVQQNLSTLFVASNFFVPWIAVKPMLRNKEKVSLSPQNRGVTSTEVTDTEIMWAFFQNQILCPMNGGVLSKEVSQRRNSTVTKKSFLPLWPWQQQILFHLFCTLIMADHHSIFFLKQSNKVRIRSHRIPHNSGWLRLNNSQKLETHVYYSL